MRSYRKVLWGAGLAVAALVAVVAAGLAIAQDQETLRVRVPLAAGDPGFPPYLAQLLGSPLTAGDAYIVHTNGEAAFPAMLDAIAGARRRISFETYIFDKGDVAGEFVDAFEAAARRGVAVRLVLDAVGAETIDMAQVARLEAAGCQIGWFNTVASYSLEEANYRTHRKELVIDGEVAFVGGIGIADHWRRDTEGMPAWRDTQIEVRGAAASNIEGGFYENWIETGGIVEPDLTRHGESPGSAASIVVWSSPEGGANEMKLLYLLALASARRTIDIQSPYLITDESTQWGLHEALGRGVRVRMLVEGDRTDAKPVKYAGRAAYEDMLAAGIEIFEYQPTMMHTKAVVVDGVLSIIGSANFDNRSFELNDELNVAAFDRVLAARLARDFERDLQSSRKLELAAWRSRPAYVKARERFWSYFGELF